MVMAAFCNKNVADVDFVIPRILRLVRRSSESEGGSKITVESKKMDRPIVCLRKLGR
jgi:hypothetical protein